MEMTDHRKSEPLFNAAELAALAHLYRGEMYRSKIWRTRLDTTTNWGVATAGIGLSLTFSNPENSALPLILMTLLVAVFLGIEARRYRYFDIWRTRTRLLEVGLFAPILRGEGARANKGWNNVLADDYARLRFHISYWEAAGRRLRRNYAWIFSILGIGYLGKIAIHPTPARTLDELWNRAAVGPLEGQVVFLIGAVFHISWLLLAFTTVPRQRAAGRVGGPDTSEDQLLKLDIHV